MSGFGISEQLKSTYQVLDQVHELCDEQYNELFSNYFEPLRALRVRLLGSDDKRITDAELEDILTNLPLTLLDVSEKLNRVRLDGEVLKLKIKSDSRQLSKKDIPEDVAEDLQLEIDSENLMLRIQSYLASRVENEVSACKELIMTCKKLWDSRRQAETVMPVSEKDYSVPEYDVKKKSTYIK